MSVNNTCVPNCEDEFERWSRNLRNCLRKPSLRTRMEMSGSRGTLAAGWDGSHQQDPGHHIQDCTASGSGDTPRQESFRTKVRRLRDGRRRTLEHHVSDKQRYPAHRCRRCRSSSQDEWSRDCSVRTQRIHVGCADNAEVMKGEAEEAQRRQNEEMTLVTAARSSAAAKGFLGTCAHDKDGNAQVLASASVITKVRCLDVKELGASDDASQVQFTRVTNPRVHRPFSSLVLPIQVQVPFHRQRTRRETSAKSRRDERQSTVQDGSCNLKHRLWKLHTASHHFRA